MIRKRSRLLCSPLVIGTVLLAACSSTSASKTSSSASTTSQAATKSAIPIDLITYLSGNPTFDGPGSAVQAGVVTGVYAVNSAGGVDGHPLVIKTYDTQANPTVLADAVQNIINDHPAAMTGFLTSADLSTARATLDVGKVPWIFTTAPPSIVDQMKYIRVIGISNQSVADELVADTKQLLGGSLTGKKIAFEMLSPSSGGEDLRAKVTADLQADGGSPPIVIRDPSVISSWTSQAANVVSEHIDAVISNHSASGVVPIGKALFGVAGFTGPLLTVSTADPDTVFAAINSPHFYGLRETANLVSGSPLYNEISKANASVAAATANASFFARGYTAAWVIAQTLSKCGVPCAQEQFPAVVNQIGSFQIPMNPFLAGIDFSDNYGVHHSKLFQYDATQSAAVAVPTNG